MGTTVRARRWGVGAATMLIAACGSPRTPEGGRPRDDGEGRTAREATTEPSRERFEVPYVGGPEAPLSDADREQERRDASWRRYARLAPPPSPTGPSTGQPERWDAIDVAHLARVEPRLPLTGDAEGPTALAAQVLLDRAWSSPGIVDGQWGANAEKAVYFFQQGAGLPRTGVLDRPTWDRLTEAAGRPAALVADVTLDDEAVKGPFVRIPQDMAARAKLDCLCYTSVAEKLAERFHTTEDVLGRLNPGVSLDAVKAGDVLHVPAVREPGAPARGEVARIEISDGARWLHALDAQGRIVLSAPVTVGSMIAPSPEGDLQVEGVHPDPWWHYQPAKLTGVPDWKPSAHLPPGPNSPVGVVWIALSKEGYGIHGTDAPDTIGYASSHGCVRLTNWDASTLAPLVRPGLSVRFVDLGAEPAAGAPGAVPPARPSPAAEPPPKPRPSPG